MLVAIAAVAFLAVIIAVNDDDDDETETTDNVETEPPVYVAESGTLTEGDDLMSGSSEDDTYFAKNGDDTVSGNDGDDRLFGNQGDDLLIGDAGDDFQRGGVGDDELYGETGDDVLMGDAGDDFQRGGDGNDQLNGGSGDDVLFGDADQDTLMGDTGDDTIFGGIDDDQINGGEGHDVLVGDGGSDTIEGGDGDDRLFGGWIESKNGDLIREDNTLNADGPGDLIFYQDTATDELYGGAGNDILYVNKGDVAAGGTGEDTFVLFASSLDATSDLTDFDSSEDTLIYEYNQDLDAPTLELVDDLVAFTQTLLANGNPVAVMPYSGLTVDQIAVIPIEYV
jgi:Ca2+-binding RTX toxin-like protein